MRSSTTSSRRSTTLSRPRTVIASHSLVGFVECLCPVFVPRCFAYWKYALVDTFVADTPACVACAQVVPQCNCKDGQTCEIVPQTCTTCSVAVCKGTSRDLRCLWHVTLTLCGCESMIDVPGAPATTQAPVTTSGIRYITPMALVSPVMGGESSQSGSSSSRSIASEESSALLFPRRTSESSLESSSESSARSELSVSLGCMTAFAICVAHCVGMSLSHHSSSNDHSGHPAHRLNPAVKAPLQSRAQRPLRKQWRPPLRL